MRHRGRAGLGIVLCSVPGPFGKAGRVGGSEVSRTRSRSRLESAPTLLFPPLRQLDLNPVQSHNQEKKTSSMLGKVLSRSHGAPLFSPPKGKQQLAIIVHTFAMSPDIVCCSWYANKARTEWLLYNDHLLINLTRPTIKMQDRMTADLTDKASRSQQRIDEQATIVLPTLLPLAGDRRDLKHTNAMLLPSLLGLALRAMPQTSGSRHLRFLMERNAAPARTFRVEMRRVMPRRPGDG